MNWTDAINVARGQASGKRTAAGNPTLTNTEASGLILFAREVAVRALIAAHPVTFDWYGFALSALGWRQAGDEFDMSARQRGATFADSNALWIALDAMARDLDAAHVPFKMVRDPTGTEGSYRELAKLAWAHMQEESPDVAAASERTTAARKARERASAPAKPARRDEPARAARREDSGGVGVGAVMLIALAAYAMFSE